MTISNRKIEISRNQEVGELKQISCDEFNNLYFIFNKNPMKIEMALKIPFNFKKPLNKKNQIKQPEMSIFNEDVIIKLSEGQSKRLIRFLREKFKV